MSEAQASSEPLPHPPDRAPTPADTAADMALILAALGRLEATVREGREVLARLRGCLADMANAITKAKAIADSPAALSLLNEFEHRIDVMIEIAGAGDGRAADAAEAAAAEGAAAPDAVAMLKAAAPEQEEAAAEPTEVPTVSGVISRLDASHGETPSAAADTPEASEHPGVDASNVAMLTAMVQALRESMPPDAAEASDAAAPAAVNAPEHAAAPDAVAAEVATAEAGSPETASSEASPAGPAPPAAQETDAPADQANADAVEPDSQQTAADEPDASLDERRLNMAASLLPSPEFVSLPAEPVREPPQHVPPGDPSHFHDPSQDTPRAYDPMQSPEPAHDPLRALKAMSEYERLALFS